MYLLVHASLEGVVDLEGRILLVLKLYDAGRPARGDVIEWRGLHLARFLWLDVDNGTEY